MTTCQDVWEHNLGGDRIIWGYCKKPKGHPGPCGPPYESTAKDATC